jgi:hypothetical protein
MGVRPMQILLITACLLVCAAAAGAAAAPAGPAPFVNTWLVAGPFDNDAQNTGFKRDWVGEATVAPREGAQSGGKPWRFFDDRLFSRSYDDYQDLYSYFHVKRGESVAAKVVYAHVYVHSARGQPAQLRVGADNEFRAWVNGAEAAASTKSTPHRDTVRAKVALKTGWNRLLLKVANQSEGRLGFYARLCGPDGGELPSLTYSPAGGAGLLAVATGRMADINTGDLPIAFYEWPYVAANPLLDPDLELEASLRRKPQLVMHASPFVFTAGGGKPPYRWQHTTGALPLGVTINPDGTLTGTVTEAGPARTYNFQVTVRDAAGAMAVKEFSLAVRDRPNRWYGQARLVGLVHNPESMLAATDADLAEFARLMKRQGYGLGMMISYNNGDFKYRWPSRFEPNSPDLAGRYKKALEAEGVRFGMYLGNLIGPNHGGDDGALLMVEDAVRRYQPAALWFDWANPDRDGYVSLDALYSMIRVLSPDTLIVLNGVGTLYQGDWDVLSLEGWGAWGGRAWAIWPFPVRWPKAVPVEAWRMLPDPAFEHSRDTRPDWQEALRVQLSIIGQGFVANMDHSPTIRTPYKMLYESPVAQAHRQMAEWANPPGGPPLHTAYTHVMPGPLDEAAWGYDLISLSRDAIYLHALRNPFGKTGLPEGGVLAVGPVRQRVRTVTWMNANKPLRFEQQGLVEPGSGLSPPPAGSQLVIHLDDVTPDPVDTILKVELAGPHPPDVSRTTPEQPSVPPGSLAMRRAALEQSGMPPGNLATRRPARLLSADGSRPLVASALAFARYGVDGLLDTHAQGAYEWAWAYHVDLEGTHPVRRVVIHFAPGGYATQYRVLLSTDSKEWKAVANVKDGKGGMREHAFAAVAARYVRVQGVKPDGPDQEGGQMGIAELEVYE